jgi:hypothetical protein
MQGTDLGDMWQAPLPCSAQTSAREGYSWIESKDTLFLPPNMLFDWNYQQIIMD